MVLRRPGVRLLCLVGRMDRSRLKTILALGGYGLAIAGSQRYPREGQTWPVIYRISWHALGTSSEFRRHRDLERHCRTARQAPTVTNIANANYPIAAETLARFLRLQGLANVISKMQTLRLLGKRAFPSAYSRYIQWQYRRVSIAERVEAILCSQDSPSHYDDEFNA